MVSISIRQCLLLSLPLLALGACSESEKGDQRSANLANQAQGSGDAIGAASGSSSDDNTNVPDETTGAAEAVKNDATPANEVIAEENKDEVEVPPTAGEVVPLALTSGAFANNGAIPLLYASAAQGGSNMSPPLAWGKAPATAGSFAVQMVDLDSIQAGNPRVHWVITDIKIDQTGLPVNIPAGNNLVAPPEALGANQPQSYGGPNPPNLHRYQWTVYAIKKGETLVGLTSDNSAANKSEFEGKAVSMATLTGTYDPN